MDNDNATVNKNIIGSSKIQLDFCCTIKLLIYQYFERNTILFNAPHIVIAFGDRKSCRSLTLLFVFCFLDWFMASFLFYSPYSYC